MENRMDDIWEELTSNFSVLEEKEKKAMILRTVPLIIGIYEEFGYQFDGIDNARELIKKCLK